jgi:hypothetical protein
MRVLRRYGHILLFFAVVLLACVMVLHQFLANENSHVQQREDFIALHERGDTKLAGHHYQLLIRALPKLTDDALWRDVQRTAMIVDTKVSQPESFVWKYHVSVNNELRQRTTKRIERMLESAEAK